MIPILTIHYKNSANRLIFVQSAQILALFVWINLSDL